MNYGPCNTGMWSVFPKVVHHSTHIFSASRLWIIRCRLIWLLAIILQLLVYSMCYLGSQITGSSDAWPRLQLLLREGVGGILLFYARVVDNCVMFVLLFEVLPSKMIVKKCSKINYLSVWCGFSGSFRKDISFPSHSGNVRQVVHRRGNRWPSLTAHACHLTSEWL